MRYVRIEHEACHLCRNALLTGEISPAYTRNERAWVIEAQDRACGERWHEEHGATSDFCTVCDAGEPGTITYLLVCYAPAPGLY